MSKFASFARSLRPSVAQARVSSICLTPTTGTIFRALSAAHGHGHGDHHDDHHGAHHDNDTFLDPKVTCDRIMEVIGNFEQVLKQVTPSSRLREDLDLDSLDTVEIVIALEDEFVLEIPDSEAEKFFAVPDIVDYISKHPMAKG